MEAQASIAAVAARRRLGGADWIVLACLLLAAGLAWAWLLTPAAMTMGDGPAPWSATYLVPAFSMWALMMVAMMLPSATPMILLHARVARQGNPGPWPVATLAFALAYLGLWTAFAALAALTEAALATSGVISVMNLRFGNAQAAAVLLALAVAYNLSAAKRVCLDKCRSPLSFVMRGWRPGVAGALRMGLAHGLYCIGCCWLLMALLFVGGVMNLAWVAALTGVVLAEKYGPRWASGVIAGLLASAALMLLMRG